MKYLLLNANRVGIGTYHRALYFGRELARRGHSVTMMTVSNASRLRKVVRNDSANFNIVECPNLLDELLPWHASGPLDIWHRLRELWRGQYDVVYAFEYQPNISIPVFLTRRVLGFRLISDWCDWHAGGSYHFGGYRVAHAIDRVFEEFIRHRADYVTTINRTLYDRARSIGIEAKKLSVVGEGVDPTFIVPVDKHEARRRLGLPDVLMVGTIRDSYRSGELLCRAVARSVHSDLHLLVIGSKTDALRTLAEELGIADRLLTPGRVSDEDLPSYIGASDVLALPLEDDIVNRGRWPHKLGDMLAARRPVVVSRGGEFPRMLEQRGCAIMADFGADSFASKIDAVIARPADYADVANRGRQLIESELNWDVIGEQLEQALKRANAL